MAGASSSFTTAETVGLNRNNLPRPTNRARNIVPPLEAGRLSAHPLSSSEIASLPSPPLAAPEIRHWHSKIQSRVNKFAQNLHVLKVAVEAEKEGLDPRSKQVRLFVLHRPRGKVRYVAQCSFVLQY
jgi:hypothetical protein